MIMSDLSVWDQNLNSIFHICCICSLLYFHLLFWCFCCFSRCRRNKDQCDQRTFSVHLHPPVQQEGPAVHVWAAERHFYRQHLQVGQKDQEKQQNDICKKERKKLLSENSSLCIYRLPDVSKLDWPWTGSSQRHFWPVCPTVFTFHKKMTSRKLL